jgi:hypothetical protein
VSARALEISTPEDQLLNSTSETATMDLKFVMHRHGQHT